MHWDCYASWVHRERLASAIFDRSWAQALQAPRWGIAACTLLALVIVNPDEDARAVEVVLARTGAIYRVPLEDWGYWLSNPAAAHPFEQQTLDEALAPLRGAMASAARLIERAIWPQKPLTPRLLRAQPGVQRPMARMKRETASIVAAG